MHDAVPAIAAAGASPIVRIPDMQSWMVKRETSDSSHIIKSLYLMETRCIGLWRPWRKLLTNPP
jgi:hypothetical protein